jgi:predicted nucleotidyltransferase
MRKAIPKDIQDTIKRIQKKLKERFRDNLKSLILYGSWAKGTARKNSDIDLLAVFESTDEKVRKNIDDISYESDARRTITIVPCSLEDLRRETIPLYTAIKKEGKTILGTANLSLSPEPPEVKYAEFIKKSQQFETHKIDTAEELLTKELTSGIPEFCFMASKHAIQAALAMNGKGYTSKVSELIPQAEKYLGKEFSTSFKHVFDIYVRAEYELMPIFREEASRAIKYARKTMEVYKKWGRNEDNI